MGDRLRGHENYPSAESVLDRLNQIDLRLRQLEKKERLPDSCFAGEKGRRNQLPSDMVHAHIKEALMDRLNLLETRIRQVPGSQLSEELDNGGSSSGGGHSKMAITFPAETQKQIQCSSSSRRELGWPCSAESGNYQSQMPKKVIEPMQADTTKAMDKRAAAFRRNEKRRMERARLFKRWFQVGC